MSEQQSSTQVGIIVVAHADYGSAMLRTAEFILGTLSDCTSISVDIAQEVPETVRRLDDAAQRLDKGSRRVHIHLPYDKGGLLPHQSGPLPAGEP